MICDNAKRTLLLACLCLVLAGCAPSDDSRIVGTWRIESVDSLSGRMTTGESAEVDTEKMTIRFDRSGRLQTKTSIGKIDSTKDGTWRFISDEPDTNIMRIACTLRAQMTEHEIEFENDETIIWVPPNMAGTSRRIRFVRSR